MRRPRRPGGGRILTWSCFKNVSCNFENSILKRNPILKCNYSTFAFCNLNVAFVTFCPSGLFFRFSFFIKKNTVRTPSRKIRARPEDTITKTNALISPCPNANGCHGNDDYDDDAATETPLNKNLEFLMRVLIYGSNSNSMLIR